MLKNHRYVFLVILLGFSYITNQLIAHDQIIQISIPKCGTHLLEKCICLLTGRKGGVFSPRKNNPPIDHFVLPTYLLYKATNLPAHQFLKNHLMYTRELEKYFDRENFRRFFIYRDPRDQVVSYAFYMLKYKKSFGLEKSDITLAQLILELIKFRPIIPIKQHGIANVYKTYLSWLSAPGFLAIRFEDLVGIEGGGDAQIQYNTIKKIVSHLKINASEADIQRAISNQFGGVWSFREGKIGAWKQYFNAEHKQAFKAMAQDILEILGYEKDANW